MANSARDAIRVGLEVGAKRTFAWVDDWPGWCRAGRDETAALAALETAASRYAPIAAAAGLVLPWHPGAPFEVVERVAGDAGTDFGVPGKVAAMDRVPTSRAEGERIVAILEAAWVTLDSIVAAAPAELRRGPRGGGRDRDKIFGHVVAAENAYARVLGVKLREPDPTDLAAVAAQRQAISALLREPSDGSPIGGRRWPPKTAARRITWHVLDHAWEIEDRTETPAP